MRDAALVMPTAYWKGDRTAGLNVLSIWHYIYSILYRSFVLCAGMKYFTYVFCQLYPDWFKNKAAATVGTMFDMQFLQIQFKSDFHWCSSNKMRTKQNLKCLAWQCNRQQWTQGGGGHRLRPSEQSFACSQRKMFVMFACVPTSSVITVPGCCCEGGWERLNKQSTVIGALTHCRQPFSGTRYKSDITAVQKNWQLIYLFFYFLNFF